MITIILVLIVFIFYVYIVRLKEGLINQYHPISIKNDELDPLFTRLTNVNDVFYDEKYNDFLYQDIKMDLAYFNNTTDLLYRLSIH